MKILTIIKWLAIFFIVAFPFGQLIQIPFPLKELEETRIYLIDILIFLIILLWLAWHLIIRKKIIFPFSAVSYFLWLGILFSSWILNFKNFTVRESFVGLLYFFRYLVYSSIYLVFFDLKKNSPLVSRKRILNVFSFWAFMIAFLGIGQYLLFPDTRLLSALGWDEHYYRVIGTFFDPNFTGLILALGILFLLVLVTSGNEGGNKKIKFLPAIFFLSAPFFLTYSRSSYLALIFGVASLLILKRKFKLIIFFLISFSFFLLFLPRPGGEGVRLERTASIWQRIENWQASISIIKRNWLVGVGFNNYRYALRRTEYLNISDWLTNHAASGTDNSFLFILATSGFAGFCCFTNFWLQIIRRAFLEKDLIIKRLVICSLITVFVHSFFINSYFYLWVIVWLMLTISLLD